MEHEKLTLAIVDDHNLFRNGLKLLLGKSAPETFAEILEATNGSEFLHLMDSHKIDIALMDISMPVLNGQDTTKLALEKDKDLKVVALTMYNEDEYYFKMIEAGVHGFLLKEADIQEVIFAIKTVIEGNSYFPASILRSFVKIQNTTSNIDLSDRELEVLRYICLGHSNFEIADELSLSKRTVDKHRANILLKTGCKNTANLVVFSVKNGLVDI